ncbi:hypothetical protein CMEL01_10747, partial [Colletotrichum melonis]
ACHLLQGRFLVPILDSRPPCRFHPPRSSAPALPTCHACLNLSSRWPAFPFASRRRCLLLVLLTLCLNGTPHFTTVR